MIIVVLVLPFAELYFFFGWIESSPAVALSYMGLTMAAGVFCMRFAKAGFGEFLRRARHERVSPLALLLFGKLWLAGALLFFPGVMSDVLAAAMWLGLRFYESADEPPVMKARFVDETKERAQDKASAADDERRKLPD